jgi:cbb3-type cytochrome oxidase maturation protein
MYYPYFITYMLLGFAASLVVFLWALNNSQFKDQERARYLPLFGEPVSEPARVSKVSRIESIALFSLACVGLLLITAVLGFGILKG